MGWPTGRALPHLVLWSLLAGLGVPEAARAQYYDDGYGYGYRRAPAYRPAPEPQRPFYWPWENRSPAQPYIQDGGRPAARGAYRTPRPRREREVVPSHEGRSVQRPKPRPAPVVARPAAPKPKTDPRTQIAVFGDSLAELLGRGLDTVYESNPDVTVIRRAKGDSGLVRKDVVDWPKAAEDYLKSNPKVTYAVVMVGANDRQPLRDGDQTVEPLSERWRALYRDRVDALLKVFTDRKVPVVWVGEPPMKSETLSADITSLNEIFRDRVQRAGGVYVDIWPAFVGEDNRYAATGPDLEGQQARLRTSDGVHFTQAGARKAAHFADVEIKRLIEATTGTPALPDAVTPLAPEAAPAAAGEAKLDDDAAIDRLITTMLPSLPEPPGIPALPVKPAAGPVLPLTRNDVSPGGQLVTGRPRIDRDTGYTLERSLIRGAAPTLQPGRADDFRWPRG
ncbi:SGNH/GDSL hydrolase family protein [Methylobacterium aquaticum]|uniref:SGNH/GDSL hydrolase family protein n=1 Tax=Methylobacterium aquaticum TaxID=270351 RepID=UPI000A9F6DA1|nr:SGNH family hydrolase [Methylobacterium aquaticum]